MKPTTTRRTTVVRRLRVEPESIGERVNWVRINRGLSQATLASVIGITAASVSFKENNKSNFTSDQLAVLGQEYNVNMNWLYFGEGQPYRTKK